MTIAIKGVMLMRILVAEDEKSLARALVKIFEKNNYSADAVYNGLDALSYLENGNYDAAVLDIMMPGLDGISVLKKIREQGSEIPIMLLTAKSETEDKILGLDSGANDYLTKPFDARELLARLRAITRSHSSFDSTITIRNITLNRATFEVSSPYGSYKLANKEFQMLELFMSNPHCLISTEKFMEKIWGFDSDSDISVVWIYISYLRKKLASLNAEIQIKTSRNAGYSLEEVT